jgi:hypothetical protein
MKNTSATDSTNRNIPKFQDIVFSKAYDLGGAAGVGVTARASVLALTTPTRYLQMLFSIRSWNESMQWVRETSKNPLDFVKKLYSIAPQFTVRQLGISAISPATKAALIDQDYKTCGVVAATIETATAGIIEAKELQTAKEGLGESISKSFIKNFARVSPLFWLRNAFLATPGFYMSEKGWSRDQAAAGTLALAALSVLLDGPIANILGTNKSIFSAYKDWLGGKVNRCLPAAIAARTLVVAVHSGTSIAALNWLKEQKDTQNKNTQERDIPEHVTPVKKEKATSREPLDLVIGIRDYVWQERIKTERSQALPTLGAALKETSQPPQVPSHQSRVQARAADESQGKDRAEL